MNKKGRKNMNIGNTISELRKKNHLTQEELAEKLNVARQTISKWECNETSPSLEDASKLAKIFKVSLDELTGNKNVLEEKVSNVERLAGIIIKILKIIGVLIIIYFIFLVVGIFVFTAFRDKTSEEVTGSITCTLNNETETYQVREKDNKLEISKNASNIIDINSYNNGDDVLNAIINYYENNKGTCN